MPQGPKSISLKGARAQNHLFLKGPGPRCVDYPFFLRFFSILEASWAPSWIHVEAMLATKPSKKHLPKQPQKNTEKGRVRVICRWTLGSLKLTENIPCQGSTGEENTPSQLALWRIYI